MGFGENLGDGKEHKLIVSNAAIREVFIGKYEKVGITMGIAVLIDTGEKRGVQLFGGVKFRDHGRFIAFVEDILELFGVDSINDLQGIPVRVKRTDDKIHEIGHFMQEKWLNIGAYV